MWFRSSMPWFEPLDSRSLVDCRGHRVRGDGLERITSGFAYGSVPTVGKIEESRNGRLRGRAQNDERREGLMAPLIRERVPERGGNSDQGLFFHEREQRQFDHRIS